MRTITFVDTEVSVESNRIHDIGAVKPDGAVMHEASIIKLQEFLDRDGFVAGHNIIKFDCKYLKEKMGTVYEEYFRDDENVIDTLLLSSLLFPKRPYHKLLKDDKLDTDELNNPLNDAKKSMVLFDDEMAQFERLPKGLKDIFYGLLHDKREFAAFFKYIDYSADVTELNKNIRVFFMQYTIFIASLEWRGKKRKSRLWNLSAIPKIKNWIR